MSRFVRRAVLAAGVTGALLTGAPPFAAPAQADMPVAPGLACAGPVPAYGRPACRSPRMAQRRVRTYRPAIVELAPERVDPAIYRLSRYVSLLVLGVGY